MPYEPFKLYSRRQAEANGELPDVYEYDELPREFRERVYHVIIETYQSCKADDRMYQYLEDEFAKMKGERSIGNSEAITNIVNYIINEDDEDVLDLIEYLMYLYNNVLKDGKSPYKEIFSKAIEEINYWFRYNGLGYEFKNGQIIRIDNQLIHEEAVKPALFFLSDPRFTVANEEMLEAYEHRRKGKNSASIHSACKAFETTMKCICKEKKYTYDSKRDNAKKLISILKDNGYFPQYMDTHVSGILTTLESGLPTIRNKNGGHGPDPDDNPVPDAFVDYALNLAATNIAFLARLIDIEP